MFGLKAEDYEAMQAQEKAANAAVKPLTDVVDAAQMMDAAAAYTFSHVGRYLARMLDAADETTPQAYAKLAELLQLVQANNRHKRKLTPTSFPSADFWCRLIDADGDTC